MRRWFPVQHLQHDTLEYRYQRAMTGRIEVATIIQAKREIILPHQLAAQEISRNVTGRHEMGWKAQRGGAIGDPDEYQRNKSKGSPASQVPANFLRWRYALHCFGGSLSVTPPRLCHAWRCDS